MLHKNLTIGGKITSLVLAVVVVSVTAVSYFAYQFSQQALDTRYADALNAVADLKLQQINRYFKDTEASLLVARQSPTLHRALPALLDTAATANHELAESDLDAVLLYYLKQYNFSNIYLTSPNGVVVYEADRLSENQVLGEGLRTNAPKNAAVAGESVRFSPAYAQGGKRYFVASAPILTTGGVPLGTLVFEVDLQNVYAFARDTVGLGQTGEILLGQLAGQEITYLNPTRHDPRAAFARKITLGDSTSTCLQEAVRGVAGFGKGVDYRKQPILAAWRPVPGLTWGMSVEIDQAEVYAPIRQLRNTLVGTVVIVVLGALLLSLVAARLFVTPLRRLKTTMTLLSEGILPEQLARRSNDEIGEMTGTVNSLVEGLKKTANFAHQIGEGNFEASFTPMSQQDMLGLALLNMRDNLQGSTRRDEERNWIVQGVAEVGDILRATDHLEDLGDRLLAYLVRKINAVQGAFYVVSDPQAARPTLDLTASYAFNKKKYLQASFRFAEGLVGQAAIEQDTLLRTEVPDKYVTISSGLLGDRKPKCLLVVPLITTIGSERVVYGALELAGFDKFSPRNVAFVKEVSEIIARTVFNIKVNGTTRTLLEMSQKQSEELQEQQEVLRQNAEEMEATQEELRRSNGELEFQIEEVNRTQKRMQILLENASEIITIYERDGQVRYVSPSVTRILGYAPAELMGSSDAHLVHEQGLAEYQRIVAQVLADPDHSATAQFSYRAKGGDMIWLEATVTNMLHDPAVAGVVMNSRDITERRAAEQEARMRGQMQALSENSPDLITRLDRDGKIFYINPMIESYTGHATEDFLLKNLAEVPLNEQVMEAWRQIIDKVISTSLEVTKEMPFPSVMGECVMQVSAIPEYNENNHLESVLLVSHDITQRKQIELEIQAKNKKITESINYARRIQSAILPDLDQIRAAFPDSFMLYKPRDVVSGDFPWFVQRGEDTYLAAVDCTGHGVPGALISLIGYFLLNNIVKNGLATTPGEILDLLDESVTQTLKQDMGIEDASRDGMDIVLCKVNQRERTLQYAAAHRPLYYVSGGALEEIKGDKFPIGGGQYGKTRTHFTTTTLAIQPNDAVFFCSDGFPDQFGGPDNRKFSPKRIRDLIADNPALNMAQMHQLFEREFEAWRGICKQTDDVLMVGIRF